MMCKLFRSCCALLGAWALLSIAALAQENDAGGGPDSTATAGQLIISEFRLVGPNGATDEFIEIYNTSDTSHTVAASDSSAGYAVAASDGVVRFTIPNGTVIPGRGHFLGVNSDGYSLDSYAAGDAAYTTDIPDDAGIALFNTATTANFTLTHRLDAVGPTSEANTLYREGAGYPPLTPFLIEGSFFRTQCGGATCPAGGNPVDTDNNALDFQFTDTDATNAGAGQRLGAPGSENLTSPIRRDTSGIGLLILDGTKSPSAQPNRVRDMTSNPANNSTFGTLSSRRRVVNSTGANVTRLRFRFVEITTFPAPSGSTADLRVLTSSSVMVSGVTDSTTCLASTGSATTPCTVTVRGTTLEQPPTQPNGGGYNSTLAVGTITTSTPLPPGASVNVQFLLGVQQTGLFRFLVTIEALP
jgi:hypothetical protein